MSPGKEILIVGAGPSGLSLAIFLKHYGFHPRIIDKKTEVSLYSKAFGVNPQTLSILEEFGVADRFLQNGRKLQAMNIWHKGKVFFRNELKYANHKYPFIIVQSQRDSELILAEEAARRGINVEFGTQLLSVQKNGNGFSSAIRRDEDQVVHSDILIGADGSHSDVRTQTGIESDSFGYRGAWELYDVELDIDIPPDDANLFFFYEGGMILIRIKEKLWRVAGSMKDLLSFMPKGTTVGKIHWQTKFNIGHKLAECLTKDNAVIIGDAAHIHSPFGGRGMNLGIQDAYLVSKAIRDNKLNEYSASRMPYLKKTVGRINNMTTLITADSGFRLFLKKCAWMAKPFMPMARPAIRKFVLGLDT